jgi:hypothetical protein
LQIKCYPMTAQQAIYQQILDMDEQMIPYTEKTLIPRKKLVAQLNEIGYTVGLGNGHKVVLRPLPSFNPLPPVNTNF